MVQTGESAIECGRMGSGPPVLMLPGRGGAATDQYLELGTALAESGYSVIAVNPRGVGRSRGPLKNLTLHDYARDIAAVQKTLGEEVHVVGRALGNRMARCFAADYPGGIKSVTLIAAGGLIPSTTTRTQHQIRRPAPPLRHWREAGIAQELAARSTALDDWWDGGEVPMLVLQGLQDPIAVPENGRRLAKAFPDRVRLREVENAGHLLLFEHPGIVLAEVLAFLRDIERS